MKLRSKIAAWLDPQMAEYAKFTKELEERAERVARGDFESCKPMSHIEICTDFGDIQVRVVQPFRSLDDE